MFQHAIVRLPGAALARGLTRVDLGPPDLALAERQHVAYCDALRRAGLDVTVLPDDEAYPDGTFVEDTAIVLPEGALLTRPGAPSRAGEVAAVAAALGIHYTSLAQIDAPGTVDGGDICVAGRRVYIGRSARTNAAGAAQLAQWLAGLGYDSVEVDITGIEAILHLKSGMAAIAGGRLLLIEALADHAAFEGCERMVVDAGEAYAANAVQVNGMVFVAAGYPKLAAQLQALGYAIEILDMSEYAKLDGGLSCLSLRF